MTSRLVESDQRYQQQGDYGRFTVGSYYRKLQRGGNSPQDKSIENQYVMELNLWNDSAINLTYIYPPELGRPPVTYNAVGSMEWWGFGASWGGDPSWTTDDEYRLLSKLTAKIRDHQFNLAVFGAEARDSLEMIADSAFRIASAIRYVKRGDLTRAARSLGARKPGKVYKDVGNNWLELQYGWLPLLGDAYSAGEAMASILNRPQQTEFRQRRSRNVGVNPMQSGNTGIGVTTKQVVAKMKEDYSAISSLGLDDPLTVAWELLPYSFVADWFLPIGDFLEYRQVMGGTKATFVVTTTQKLIVQGGDGRILPDGTQVLISGGDAYRNTSVNMVREVRSSYDVPLPSFQNPLDLSWRRAVSAIALVGQRFK